MNGQVQARPATRGVMKHISLQGDIVCVCVSVFVSSYRGWELWEAAVCKAVVGLGRRHGAQLKISWQKGLYSL